MSAQLQPSIWMEFKLEPYPSGSTVTYKWSARPLADANAWKEGRVITWGDITRSLSAIGGDYEVNTTTITLDDADAFIRGLLSGSTTKFFLNREATIYLLSEAGRSAGTLPRYLHRGRIHDYQVRPGRQVVLNVTDLVGSRFTGFDLDKQIPQVLIGDEHTNIKVLPSTQKNFGHVYPIYAGEHSDNGATDIAGNPVDKGICPVFDTGDYDITGSTAPPVFGAPPVITAFGAVGTTGETTYYYAASLITPFGESALSNIVAISGASSRNVSNYNWLAGTFDEGLASPFNKVRIWRSSNPDPSSFTVWLDEADYFAPTGNFVYGDGAKVIDATGGTPVATRDELDTEKTGPSPTPGGALESDTVWGRLVVAVGCYHVIGVYGSDLAPGAEPKRIRLPASLDGVEYLTADSSGWPHPDRFIELTNSAGETIRMTVIYVRGPRLNAHRDGSVTIAVNLCGPDDVGDGSGNDIDKAFYQLQWFLNTHILYNGGKGYRNGDWPGLETYTNGNAILQTSKFESCQQQTITWIGGEGYLGHLGITEPITVRDFMHRWCMTFNAHVGANHWGQIFPALVDDSAATGGPIYRDNIEIGGLDDMNYMFEVMQTFVEYSYDWDPDAQKFRVPKETAFDLSMETANKGRLSSSVRECFYCRDPDSVNDAQARFLLLVKQPPRTATFHVDLGGTQTELGDKFRLTHYDGLPDTATQMMCMKHVVRPGDTQREQPQVWLTGLDLTRIRGTAMSLLQDEGTMVGNLGDETSAQPPPTGAFELR